jgi:hypothetical protein
VHNTEDKKLANDNKTKCINSKIARTTVARNQTSTEIVQKKTKTFGKMATLEASNKGKEPSILLVRRLD